MKTTIKKVLVWLGLSVLMMIFWITGLMIGNAIFPSSLMDMPLQSNSNPELMLLLTCAINSWVIIYFISKSRFKGWQLVGIVFFVTFGIQYFMSQIETIWFNASLTLPIKGIYAVVTGGAFMNLLFAITATWLTGNFKVSDRQPPIKTAGSDLGLWLRVAVLSALVWPLVYFMAGYLVAWQFADVRLLYSGTTEMGSFVSIMAGNFASGLYGFQIFRGLLWVLIGWIVLTTLNGSAINKGIILGLLLSLLGSSQLLLPNPYMADTVRLAHLLETGSSNFLWGFIIAWTLDRYVQVESKGVSAQLAGS